MKKFYYSIMLVILVLSGCAMRSPDLNENVDEQNKENTDDSGIPDLDGVSEELNTNSLESLEEDLNYIENI